MAEHMRSTTRVSSSRMGLDFTFHTLGSVNIFSLNSTGYFKRAVYNFSRTSFEHVHWLPNSATGGSYISHHSQMATFEVAEWVHCVRVLVSRNKVCDKFRGISTHNTAKNLLVGVRSTCGTRILWKLVVCASSDANRKAACFQHSCGTSARDLR